MCTQISSGDGKYSYTQQRPKIKRSDISLWYKIIYTEI